MRGRQRRMWILLALASVGCTDSGTGDGGDGSTSAGDATAAATTSGGGTAGPMTLGTSGPATTDGPGTDGASDSTGEPVPPLTEWRVVSSDPTVHMELPVELHVDETGVYIVGNQHGPTEGPCTIVECGVRIEKRSLEDGALVPQFGVDGVVYEPWTEVANGLREARGITGDADSIYVLGYGIVERYDRATGALVWTDSHPMDCDGDIAVDATGVYLSGVINAFTTWRLEKRALADGSNLFGVSDDVSVESTCPREIVLTDGAVFTTGSHHVPALMANRLRLRRRNDATGDEEWEQELTFGGVADLVTDGSTLFVVAGAVAARDVATGEPTLFDVASTVPSVGDAPLVDGVIYQGATDPLTGDAKQITVTAVSAADGTVIASWADGGTWTDPEPVNVYTGSLVTDGEAFYSLAYDDAPDAVGYDWVVRKWAIDPP